MVSDAGAMMRAVAGAVGAAICWLAGTSLSWAQTSPFPASLERESLLVWLQRETDILPAQVVAVTPQALTSIVSTFPAGGGVGPRIVIRAEAMSAEIFARTGAMSWHVSLNADCQARRVKLGETTGYPERNLLGDRKVLRVAEQDWRTPEPGTAVEHAWRAACDTAFRGPFQSSTVKLAQVDLPTAPRSEPPPTPVIRNAVAPRAPAATRATTPVAPTRRSELVAQLGAAPSDAAAKALIADLSGHLKGRRVWVEKADVAGRTWYRAVAGDFGDSAEAARFCADLRASGKACFVRPDRQS